MISRALLMRISDGERAGRDVHFRRSVVASTDQQFRIGRDLPVPQIKLATDTQRAIHNERRVVTLTVVLDWTEHASSTWSGCSVPVLRSSRASGSVGGASRLRFCTVRYRGSARAGRPE